MLIVHVRYVENSSAIELIEFVIAA